MDARSGLRIAIVRNAALPVNLRTRTSEKIAHTLRMSNHSTLGTLALTHKKKGIHQ